MIDFRLVTGFDWDVGNIRKSTDKHGVTTPEAEQVFINQPLLTVADVKHSQAEPRFTALGRTDTDRYLQVTFTLRQRNTLIRVISVRGMNRKERQIYEKARQEA
jgi:uncharacterized protein